MLIEVVEYQIFAGIEDADAFQKNQITQAIEHASRTIENNTDRDFDQLSSTSPMPDTTELFDGNGSSIYYTRQAPIVEVTSIEYWNGTSWYDIDDANMTHTYTNGTSGDEGKVYYTDGYTFHKDVYPNNWRIVYAYGYSAIPDDIKYACCLLTRQYLTSASMKAGLRSESDGEQSFTYDLNGIQKIPQDVEKIIMRYRRFI